MSEPVSPADTLRAALAQGYGAAYAITPEAAFGALDALLDALKVYADPRNWSISRDDLDYKVLAWVGPGATKAGMPDGTEVARDALTTTDLDTGRQRYCRICAAPVFDPNGWVRLEGLGKFWVCPSHTSDVSYFESAHAGWMAHTGTARFVLGPYHYDD